MLLVIRFDSRPNCLSLIRGSLSHLQAYRNLEVSVDKEPYRPTRNGATVSSIRQWALDNGLFISEVKEVVRGSYRVTFKSHDEARLEAAEAEWEKAQEFNHCCYAGASHAHNWARMQRGHKPLAYQTV